MSFKKGTHLPNFISKLYYWFTPENRVLTVILTVAMAQGLSSITELATSYLYKDDYHLHPAQVNALIGFISIPWLIKPAWGLISDNVTFFGYRRRSYLFLMGCVCGLCLIGLGTWSSTIKSGFIILFLNSLGFAFNNVIGEALIVESAQNYSIQAGRSEEDKQKEASKNVSMFFGVKSCGILISSYLSGLVLEYLDKRQVFLIASCLPFMVAVMSNLLPEKKMSQEERIRLQQQQETEDETEGLVLESNKKKNAKFNADTYSKIKAFVSQPTIYKPIGFLLLFLITPSAGSVMFYFYTNELGFAPEFMGQLRLANSCASVLGIYIFNKYLRNVPFKKILFWSSIICFVLGLTQILLVTRANVALGIPDKLFCLGDSLIIQTFAEINMMPLLVLACRLCPKNIEGTMYALMMSIYNFGGMVSVQL